MNIARSIKTIRVERGVRQQELARRLKISAPYLSAIENGRRDPSIKLLKAICKELGISPSLLIWESVDIPDKLSSDDRRIWMMAKAIARDVLSKRAKAT
jgi:transcriptional regulator with XRE-family HTH domain